MRRRFMWRAGIFVVVLLAAVAVVISFLVAVITSVFGGHVSGVLSAFIGMLVLLVLAFGLRRVVRGTAVPVSELVEAAGRVEAGEVGTQVAERGPSEVRSLARAFNAMSSRLEETDASRRRLLADVSHELRTPLTVMQGTLEGILDGVYPADAEHLTPILEETRVLARLIDDLRTLSLSEAGVLRLHREPTDLGALVADVAAGQRAAADEAGVELTVTSPPALGTLEMDPARVRQVVGNLVANAVRFTPRGGRVSVEAGRQSDGGAWVEVRDTGVGIPAESVEHVFERFHRSPGSPGSGLGLSIARNLVEAHGGRITLESEVGGGTEVRFTLPAEFVEGLPTR